MLNCISVSNERVDTNIERSCNEYDLRSKRSECEDMQLAIGYVYDLKKKLNTLHPNCVNLIEKMLQIQRIY